MVAATGGQQVNASEFEPSSRQSWPCQASPQVSQSTHADWQGSGADQVVVRGPRRLDREEIVDVADMSTFSFLARWQIP